MATFSASWILDSTPYRSASDFACARRALSPAYSHGVIDTESFDKPGIWIELVPISTLGTFKRENPNWASSVLAKIPAHLPARSAYRNSTFPDEAVRTNLRVERGKKGRVRKIEESAAEEEVIEKETEKEINKDKMPASSAVCTRPLITEETPWTTELRRECADETMRFMHARDRNNREVLTQLKKHLQTKYPNIPLDERNAIIYMFADRCKTDATPTHHHVFYAMRDGSKFKTSKHESRINCISDAFSYIEEQSIWVSLHLMKHLTKKYPDLPFGEIQELVLVLRKRPTSSATELLEVMQRVESRLAGDSAVKAYDRYESLIGAIAFVKKHPSWDIDLRRYIENDFPNLKLQDREARIRLFQDFKNGRIPLDQGVMEEALRSGKYHWNQEIRRQCLTQALEWILGKVAEKSFKWEENQINLSHHLLKQFPDLPPMEMDCLIGLISLCFKEGIIKLPKKKVWYKRGPSQPARIIFRPGWEITNFIEAMENAGRREETTLPITFSPPSLSPSLTPLSPSVSPLASPASFRSFSSTSSPTSSSSSMPRSAPVICPHSSKSHPLSLSSPLPPLPSSSSLSSSSSTSSTSSFSPTISTLSSPLPPLPSSSSLSSSSSTSSTSSFSPTISTLSSRATSTSSGIGGHPSSNSLSSQSSTPPSIPAKVPTNSPLPSPSQSPSSSAAVSQPASATPKHLSSSSLPSPSLPTPSSSSTASCVLRSSSSRLLFSSFPVSPHPALRSSSSSQTGTSPPVYIRI